MISESTKENLLACDFDHVFDIKSSTYYWDMKNAFAAAAVSLHPNLTHKQAVSIAVDSWEKHKDAITIFSEEYGIDRETMHRYAHRVLNTKQWKAQKGLVEAITQIKRQSQFVVWTHGSKQMVLGLLDKYGLTGVIKEGDIYDMVGMGRKDVGVNPFLRMSDERGVEPKNSWIVDDSFGNLPSAKDAGWNTGHVYLKQSRRVTADFVDVSGIRTAYVLRSIAKRQLAPSSKVVHLKAA